MMTLFPDIKHKAKVIFGGVSLSRGDKVLFNDVSLNLSSGEAIYIQGANGIGKTSLLRLAAGFSVPDDGTVEWTADNTPCSASQVIAYQGHNDAFKPTLSAEEEIRFWADINDYEGALGDIFNITDLTDKRNLPTGKLSAGQKRRLALARLIVSQKPIWIMDEPAAAMDAAGAELIENTVRRHTARGGSVMLASHAPAKSLALSTRRLTLGAAA